MSFETFNVVRGLHILAVIAWMAGMLFLPRLYAYDAEQAGKPEPLRSEMQGLLREWQRRLLKIIVNPAMIAASASDRSVSSWLKNLRAAESTP